MVCCSPRQFLQSSNPSICHYPRSTFQHLRRAILYLTFDFASPRPVKHTLCATLSLPEDANSFFIPALTSFTTGLFDLKWRPAVAPSVSQHLVFLHQTNQCGPQQLQRSSATRSICRPCLTLLKWLLRTPRFRDMTVSPASTTAGLSIIVGRNQVFLLLPGDEISPLIQDSIDSNFSSSSAVCER